MLDWQPSKVDISLLIVSIVIGGASLAVLYSLNSPPVTAKNREQAGTIVAFSNEVKRRVPESLIWSGVSAREGVSFGDSVFTGEQSTATLQMAGAGNLALEPNSLIVFEKVNNRTLLDVRAGGALVDLAANQTMEVATAGEVVHVSGGATAAKVRIERVAQESVKLSSASGGEISVSGAKFSEKLGPDEHLRVEKTQSKKEHHKIKLRTPGPSEVVWIAPGEKIKFSWLDETPGDGYKLTVARRVGGQTPLVTQEVKGTESEAFLPGGEWLFWRISRRNDEDVAQGAFSTAVKKPPTVIFPPDHFALLQAQAQQPVALAWDANSEVAAYMVQVSEAGDFKSTLADIRTKGTSAEFKMASHPKVFWRVCFESANPLSGLCSTPRIIVTKTEAPPPAPPSPVQEIASAEPTQVEPEVKAAEIKAPEVKEPEIKVPVVEAPPPPVVEPAPPVAEAPAAIPAPKVRSGKMTLKWDANGNLQQNLNLSWPPVADAESYGVQISKNKNFKPVLVDEAVKNAKFVWKDPEPGPLFARARVIGKDGNNGPFGNPAALQVEVEAPRLPPSFSEVETVLQPEQLGAASEVQVRWPPLKKVERYRLEIKRKSGIKTSDLEHPVAAVSMKPGEAISVRVQALDKAGNPLGPFSSPSEVKFVQHLKLAAPEIVSPSQGTVAVSFGKAYNPILFIWKTVPKARGYELQFSADENFSSIYKKVETAETGFALKEIPTATKVFWRLRARVKEHSSAWSGPYYIVLNRN